MNNVNHTSVLPFANCTDSNIIEDFMSSKDRIIKLMEDNRLHLFLKEKCMNLFENNAYDQCKYVDEEAVLKAITTTQMTLNIFTLNIRSLPKHKGELVCLLHSLNNCFDVIILLK